MMGSKKVVDDEYYRILGVPVDASQTQIKHAYKKVAKEVHPDVAGGSAEAFARLSQVYTILSDPALRAQYDMHGSATKPCEEVDVRGVQTLHKVLAALMAQNNEKVLETQDIIAGCIQSVNKTIAEYENQRKAVVAEKRKVEKALKRLRRKEAASGKQGPDFVRGWMTSQITAMEGALSNIGTQIEDAKCAKTILEGYTYQYDKPEKGTPKSTPFDEFQRLFGKAATVVILDDFGSSSS